MGKRFPAIMQKGHATRREMRPQLHDRREMPGGRLLVAKQSALCLVIRARSPGKAHYASFSRPTTE
jgi:hypothetical protein